MQLLIIEMIKPGLLVRSIGAKMLWDLRSIFLLPQSWAWHHNWHVGLHCQKVCTVACYYWYCICSLKRWRWNFFREMHIRENWPWNVNSFKAFLLPNLFYSSLFAQALILTFIWGRRFKVTRLAFFFQKILMKECMGSNALE